MLTEFQKQKLYYIFTIVDYDKDGLLSFSDHQQHTMDYADTLILKMPKSELEKIKLVKKKFLQLSKNFWENITDNLKPAEVRLITKEKFFETLLITMSSSPFLPNYLWDYINLVWEVLSLKKSEGMCYTNFVYISFLHKSDETKKVFDLLNMKKKQELYIYEIYNYWLNFFYSNNKACPSKYIFGKIDY